LVAGAKSLYVALWSVENPSSNDILIGSVRRAIIRAAAISIGAAQQAAMKNEMVSPFPFRRHAAFWSPFVPVSGADGSLSTPPGTSKLRTTQCVAQWSCIFWSLAASNIRSGDEVTSIERAATFLNFPAFREWLVKRAVSGRVETPYVVDSTFPKRLARPLLLSTGANPQIFSLNKAGTRDQSCERASWRQLYLFIYFSLLISNNDPATKNAIDLPVRLNG
jgi:hypothetical protein